MSRSSKGNKTFLMLGLLLSITLTTFLVSAQTTATGTINGSPFCAGASVSVPFTTTGTFDPANVFTAQLSDATGGFGTPVNIGTLSGSDAGTITAQIPTSQGAGSGYRIRVVSSSPASITTTVNTTNLTVRALGIGAPTVSSTTVCQNTSLTISYTLNGSCAFPLGNSFTVQLSDAAGGFGSPTNLGSVSSTTAIPFTVTIPLSVPGGTGYRVRVVSSNPGITSPVNTSDIRINALGINTPAPSALTVCQGGSSLVISYTLNGGCAFQTGNSFTVQLSDASGSFATPVDIGSVTATTATNITANIPANTPGGTGYRVRVVSSNPVITSAVNTNNITIRTLGINTPTLGGVTTFCQGNTYTVTYTVTNSCPFQGGNTFRAELSNQFGSFAAPVTIGTRTGTGSGNFQFTIPANATPGNAYRIRLVSSAPSLTSADNGTNLTINALGLSAPSFTNTSFCQGEQFNLTYSVLNSCNFPNTPANVFTAQLSDASGSFAAPVTIGTRTATNGGTITAVIPAGTTPGTGYRIRVVSSNPSGLASSNNGVNLTVVAPAGTPTVFGTTAWNVYCYNSTNFSNYAGFYTESNTSFSTTTRWANNAGPSAANAASGTAYTGCVVSATAWSISMKRTNFTCGYYQIDVPSHDDYVTIFVDGVQVFQHNACCDAHTNTWTGFLGPSSQVELQVVNTGGPGYLGVNVVTAANPLTISPPVTICPSASTTLSVTSPLTLSYQWSPTVGLTPSDGAGANITAQPSSTTTYTATGTDATTSCTVSRSTTVTVSNSFSPTVAAVPATICSGIAVSTLTAAGANTYNWSPSTGLSASTGNVVTANPPSTTTYTVAASDGCTTTNITTTVTVETIPSSPTPSVFGNNTWNVYCFNGANNLTDFYGVYTENNLSFNTTSRWNANSGPAVANTTSGSAYSGCTIGGTQYTLSFKRTNFTCGYYEINIPHHDDYVTMFVDGIQVFQHNGCCDAHANAWTGFLGSSSEVELRLVNFNGPGSLQLSIVPSTSTPIVSTPGVVICAGSMANLDASSPLYPTATYTWTNSAGTTTLIDSPNSASTTAGPLNADETYTATLTDATTGCTKTATVPVTVEPLPNTTITPTALSTYCPGTPFTLTATGANTYTWSPATGLSATTGFQVVASPTVTTTYTVTGNNNCGTKDATVTITVNPLPASTIFPSGTWNIYGFNTTTYTGYQGYYTDNGSGSSGYDFNTANRWASGAAPSTANATNGQAWLGCNMPATNMSMSFKRTGFACGLYQVSIPYHDDNFAMIVDGVTVASHNGCCDVHTNIWTGTLSVTSEVEFRLMQGAGGSGLQVTFTPVPIPAGATVWLGGVSTDWFDTANWCNGVPSPTKDALVYPSAGGNQPVIGSAGAQVRSITIAGAVAAGAYNSAILPASLTTSGTTGLEVYGNWLNSGTYTANLGTISFVGTVSGGTIVNAVPTDFYNIILNRSNPTTNTTGIIQVGNSMIFTNGILIQNTALNFLAGSSVAGVSNSSYVEGQVTKTGNTAFTFPVGKGGLYRPVSISSPALTTDNFTAEYFNSSAQPTYPNSQRDASIGHVGNAEYWILNRSGGTSSVAVTLSWGSNSGGVSSPPTLLVARWDLATSRWKNQGNGSTSGTSASGTVTSAGAVNTFSVPNSVFTLASTTLSNTLPVELASFTCSCVAGIATLRWTTASEKDNDRFEIERSAAGIAYEVIGLQAGAGTSPDAVKYEFSDAAAQPGASYYRLKQVDYDGTTTYSEPCRVVNDGSLPVRVYPNPASDVINIEVHGVELGKVTIWDPMGKSISVPTETIGHKLVLKVDGQRPGIHVIEVFTGNKLQKYKIMIQ